MPRTNWSSFRRLLVSSMFTFRQTQCSVGKAVALLLRTFLDKITADLVYMDKKIAKDLSNARNS
jgi:hypothetical protein